LLLSIQYKSSAVYPGAAALTVSWNNNFAIEGAAHVTGGAKLLIIAKYIAVFDLIHNAATHIHVV